MDVQTRPTHIYGQITWKVNFASDDPFKYIWKDDRFTCLSQYSDLSQHIKEPQNSIY